MKKYSEFMKNEIKAIIQVNDPDEAAKVLYECFIEDFATNKVEGQNQNNEIERLKTIIEKLGEVISEFIDDSDFLAHVKSGIDFEKYATGDEQVWLGAFALESVELDGSKWKIGYTLDGEEHHLDFDIADYGINDLGDAIAKEMMAHAEATAV